MNLGLKDHEYHFLESNLIAPLKKEFARVFVFGSRAIGNNHAFSDIDILFIEKSRHPIPKSMISNILTFFEDSHFPYKIDLVCDSELAESYRANVNANKIEL